METEIVEVFKETENNLENFILLLKNEKIALSQNLYDDLLKIIEQKEILSDKIERTNWRMVSCLASKSLPDTHQALVKYLKRLPTLQGDLLSKQWENIIDLLKQAENLNQQNGLIIMGSKNNTEKLIDILLGRIRTGIYGKDAKIDNT